jgi:tetratricopeptide (TPR) repeat protein
MISLDAFRKNKEVDVVYGDYNFIGQDGEPLNLENMIRHSGRITKKLLRDNCVSMNTTMVRSEKIKAIGGFSNHVKVADDYDLWLRLSVKSNFLYLSEVLADYRVMENQISSDTRLRFDSNEEIITRFLEYNPDLLSSAEQKDVLNFFYTRAARHFSSSINFEIARTYFRKALSLSPSSWRTWRALMRHMLDVLKYSY